MKAPVGGGHDFTDGRGPYDWPSRYDTNAQRKMRTEVGALLAMLLLSLVAAGIFLGLSEKPISWQFGDATFWVSFRLLAIFAVGCVGGVTFSMKWLIHAVAKGKWHLDRRFWRLMVPAIGGVYACVVMTLFGGGMLGSGDASSAAPMGNTAALAFLVGYFSDGVSGLLSNVANAVFGTLEKK
ncbi:hypothetical protein ACBY01_14390 [Sphingomonas sp. ac-8]|uniref:hypothetical protein n=1 Tax=Sphingomonas sp. ac-8 TaxID=3242977 RepID=UPI003A80CFEE